MLCIRILYCTNTDSVDHGQTIGTTMGKTRSRSHTNSNTAVDQREMKEDVRKQETSSTKMPEMRQHMFQKWR